VRRLSQWFVMLMLCLIPTSMLAQFSGNIQGVVTDTAGAVVSQATVEVKNVDTGVTSQTKASDTGTYRFNSLEPGNYVISAHAPGFKQADVTVKLGTAQVQGVNIALAVGSVNEVVAVQSEATTLDTDDSRIQATLSAQTVTELPTLNRNTLDVLAVTPGVVGTGTRGSGESPGGGADNFGTQTPQISANGRSYTGNRVIVDGLDATSVVQNGNVVLSPNPDAVQEIALQPNSFDGENGLGSSLLVQITTKSGTNQFHGAANYLFTNQNLLARSYFTTGSYSPFQRQDISGAVGGPIIKDKLFFFGDIEVLRSTSTSANTSETFETPQFLAFAQQNFPNSIGTSVLTNYPLVATTLTGQTITAATYFGATCGTAATNNIPCNLPVLETGNTLQSPFYNATQYNFRVDEYIGTKDRIFGSFTHISFTQQNASPRQGLSTLNFMNNWYVQGDWTHTFNSRLLNEAAFAPSVVGGSNGEDGNFKIPQINVLKQSVGWTSGFGPGQFESREYNWKDVLSVVRGSHTLKLGVNGTHANENGDFTPTSTRPTFQFNNLLDLVEDQPFNETGVAYNPLTGQAGTVIFAGKVLPYGIFAQDDWKVKSNLSLTLSMRWDNFGNHTSAQDNFQFSNLLLGTGSNLDQQIANASVGVVPGVFAHQLKNNWSPRVGFAWDPFKHGTTTIRGGVGVYHDWVTLGQSVDELRTNPPSSITPTFSTQTAIKPLFALATSSTPPYNFPLPTIPTTGLNSHGGLIGVQTNVSALDRNLTAPLAVNYVVGVEHQFGWKTVIGANYSGSKGYNQLTGTDMNRFAGDLIVNNNQLTRLNPNFGSINYVYNGNSTSYNAMILSVRRMASDWLTLQASYTLSRVTDLGESGTRFDQDANMNIPDQHAYNSYRADANWDARNRGSISALVHIPGAKTGFAHVVSSGWELSSITAIQSGTPFWVINNAPFDPVLQNGKVVGLMPDSGDYNADGLNYDIPGTPVKDYSGSHSRRSYETGLFAASDFPQPALGTEGNLKRNSYRNPGFLQVDGSVLKNFPLKRLGEKSAMQFRVDFLNVLNRTNLNGVDTFTTDSSFGKSTSTLSPRQIQLAGRFTF
jgi:hypothetical protein